MSITVTSEVTIPLLSLDEPPDESTSIVLTGGQLKISGSPKDNKKDDELIELVELVHKRKDKVERPSALAIPTTLLRPSSNPPIVPFPASSTRHNRNRSADFDRGTTQLLNPPKTDTRLSWSPRKFSDGILNEANENQRNAVPKESMSDSRVPNRRAQHRKLSESRGVKLPDIAIAPKVLNNKFDASKLKNTTEKQLNVSGEQKASKRKQVYYSDQIQLESGASESRSQSASPNSPPLTSSPVGYAIRHPGGLLSSSQLEPPKATRHTRDTPSETPTVTSLDDALDITVFWPDNRGCQLPLINGKLAKASDIIDILAEYYSIDAPLLHETCALWMVSDLLEVQLKAHHIPYEIRNSWEVLLRRFAHLEPDDHVAGDEPLLVLKRNVLLSVEREIEIENDNNEFLTEILYVSAKEEIHRGRYLCDLDTAIHFAALQLAIEYGPYELSEKDLDWLRDDIPAFFPVQHRHSVKSVYLFGFPVVGCKGLENDILEEYQQVSRKFGSNHERRKEYLDTIRNAPFYGAAFFDGQIERPPADSIREFKKMLLAAAMPEIEVVIGINRKFVTVIDPAKHECLLAQPLFDCSWRRIDVCSSCDKSAQKHSPPCCPTVDMPCFLLHFPADDSEQLRTPDKSKLLQVFSRQAVMMEALMNALYRIALLEATDEFSDVKYDEEKISEEQERNCNHCSVEQRVEIEVEAIAIEIKAEEDFEVYDEDPAEVNRSADRVVDPAGHSKPSLESTTAAEIKLEDSTKQLAVNPKHQSAHAEESKNSDKSATISRDSAREMESQQRQPAKKPAPLQRFAAYVQQKISPSDEEGRSFASKTESKAVAGKGKRSDGDGGNHSAGSAGSSSGDSGTESNENNLADNTGSTGSRTPNGSRRNHLGSLKFLRGLKRRSTTTNATAANPQNHDRSRNKHVEGVKSADFNRKHAVLSYSTSRSPGVTSGQAIFFVNNFSKLCLATFDADGKCVDAQGSLRWVLQEA